MRGLLIAIILIGTNLSLSAQELNIKRYSNKHGLTQITIMSMNQDKTGRMWVGTAGGGLNVFNGSEFFQFEKEELKSGIIYAICRDREDNMWLGTTDVLWKYDGLNFHNYSEKYSLPSTVTNRIYEDSKGIVWVATNLGVWRIDEKNEKVQQYDLPDGEEALSLFEYEDELLVGTTEEVKRIKNGGWSSFSAEKRSDLRDVRTFIKDPFGNLLIGSGTSIVRYKKGVFTNLNQTYGLETGVVYKFGKRGKQIWIASREGVFRMDGHRFVRYNEKNGLRNNLIYDIFIDNGSNVWIGSYNGLELFNDYSFTFFSTKSGLKKDPCFSACSDRNGNIWVGNSAGEINYIPAASPDKVYHYNIPGEVGMIQALDEDLYGNLWIIIFGRGLFKVKSHDRDRLVTKKFSMESGDLNTNSSYALQATQKDLLYVFTNNGFAIVNTKKDKVYSYSVKEGLPKGTYYRGYADPEGNLWLCVWEKGVIKVEMDGYAIKKVINISDEYPETSRNLYLVNGDDRGRIVLGTADQGVTMLVPDKDKYKVKHFRQKDGMMSDNVYLVGFDKQSKMWVGTDKGVSHVTYDDDGNLVDIDNYDSENGFKGIEVNYNAFELARDGKVLFGTVENLTIFDPREAVKNEDAPKTKITDVRLQFEHMDWETVDYPLGQWNPMPTDLKLPYDQNHLSFDFEGIEFKNAAGVKYSWIMEGLDKDWSPPTFKREAVYSSIPPGKYTFKVKAMNGDGVWNEHPEEYSFVIIPPFWQTIWFYALVLVSVSGTVFGYIKRREVRLKREKRLLEEQVYQRTEELRQLNEEYKVQNENIKDSINYAQRIQQAIIPSNRKLKTLFKDSFILYKPKDIVSGDFYWINQQGSEVLVAAVDCTGHGVPGAFMSIVSYYLLEEISKISKVVRPAEILNSAKNTLPSKLSHIDTGEKLSDGMDLSLCRINKETNMMEFAGAHNPVYIIRNGEVIELRGDRIHIGADENSRYMQREFQHQEFQLLTDDTIYLFSDGYMDQVGGDQAKRLNAKRFKDLLLKVAHLPMHEQKEYLDEYIGQWRGGYEQFDDILVMGIRI